MPLKPKHHGELHPTAEKQVEAWIKKGTTNSVHTSFNLLCAQIVDYAIENGDTWLTLGITRNSDAIILTVVQQGQRAYFTGATWEDLCNGIQQGI